MLIKDYFSFSLFLSFKLFLLFPRKVEKNQENEKICWPRVQPDGIQHKVDSSSQSCKSLEFSFLGKLMFLHETKQHSF